MPNDIIQIFIAAAIATCPSLFVKKYIKTNNLFLLLFAMICYSILIYMYICIYKKKEISTAYPMILTLQIIFITLISIFIFKEKLNRNKLIGLGAGITSIIYLSCA